MIGVAASELSSWVGAPREAALICKRYQSETINKNEDQRLGFFICMQSEIFPASTASILSSTRQELHMHLSLSEDMKCLLYQGA